MTGTKRCDYCWELETRVQQDPELTRKILAELDRKRNPQMSTEPKEQQVITAAESAQAKAERKSLLVTFSERYGIEANRMMATLRATVIRPAKDGTEATNEQIASFLVVANQHDLNPFTKEIHAFLGRQGGIVCVVGVDGWAKKVNEHPQFNGMSFEQTDEQCTCTMYRKDRQHPVVVTEYFSECRRDTDPWRTHPKRMLRHKALSQCARLAFSFAGIYDPDEAERIIANEDGEIDVTPRDEPMNAAEGRKLVSPVKLRQIVEALLAAVAAKDGKALWALINEHDMTKGLDAPRYIWGELRSYEARAIRDLMTATKQYRDGLDLDAWSVQTLNGANDGASLQASWEAIQGAYQEADLPVSADVETVFIDRKQALGVP
jgi:phage recombination protein Bet